MKMKKHYKGGSMSKLRSWINKGMQIAKKHGVPLIKSHRLISRGLDRLGKSGVMGRFSPVASAASKLASQKGYGIRTAGSGLRLAGRGTRSVGGRHRRRKH
jgi:hypothetical protein